MNLALLTGIFTGLNPPKKQQLVGRDVLIVGAGVNGIVLGAKLGQLGIGYTIVEKNKDVGWDLGWKILIRAAESTRRTMPTRSHLVNRYRWSRYFSLRDEIQDYLECCATEFGVRSHIRFQTTLTGAQWIESDHCWETELEGPDGKERFRSGYLVSAIGQFNQPRKPTISGL